MPEAPPVTSTCLLLIVVTRPPRHLMIGARLSSFMAALMSAAYCRWLRNGGVSMASRRCTATVCASVNLVMP